MTRSLRAWVRRNATAAAVVPAILAGVVGAGCGRDDGSTITVFAAASLGDAFAEISASFERDHPGTEVELVLAGSATLAAQLAEDAPADVVALADTTTMDRVIATGRVSASAATTFATNRLALAVPDGNPAAISGLADLAGATVAICAPQVPCGVLTAALLARNGITLTPATEESNVTSVVTKVRLDEVDAGFVYVTDLGEGITEIAVPGIEDLSTAYPIAALTDTDDATAFVAFVHSPTGQAVLAAHGFGTP